MDSITLHPCGTLCARIALPASKSLSARALMLGALAGGWRIDNLSDCDDTRAMRLAVDRRPALCDIGAAGTAMRFSTAFFAVTPGLRRLTGSKRMLERPVRPLVEALRSLGADIRYAGREGFPPLDIRGRRLEGGEAEVPAGISSQYVSALLMVAPTLERGLRLRLRGEVASRPYIGMTLALMRRFGARACWTDDTIRVEPGGYSPEGSYTVEADWSAASYWYEMTALAPEPDASVLLEGLGADSLQGDARVAHYFGQLGVGTTFTPEGALLAKTPAAGTGRRFEADLGQEPDLAQTLVATCAALGRDFRISGLASLRIKETDRIAALRAELGKAGRPLDEPCEGTLEGRFGTAGPLVAPAAGFDTYDDHRMAMALAPLALGCGPLRINDPGVVSKSYPGFWRDLACRLRPLTP